MNIGKVISIPYALYTNKLYNFLPRIIIKLIIRQTKLAKTVKY